MQNIKILIKNRCVFKIFYELLLIYNVLISAEQQSDSVICVYTFFYIFFSIVVYQRMLKIVTCYLSILYVIVCIC